MRLDAELLNGVECGVLPSTLRLFRFKEPTVSYGRLQKLSDVSSRIPHGWAFVQRPTGGGIVYHHNDLCVSLSWSHGQAHVPRRAQEVYRWIHEIIRDAMQEPLRLATCRDLCAPKEPFPIRECFTSPVSYDLLAGEKKVVGGALRWIRQGALYQGSLQLDLFPKQDERLGQSLLNHLNHAE
jgi:lipoate-protein ligase A